MSSIFYFFEYLDIVLNVLSQCLTVYYFTIFLKNSILHTNMMRLIKMLMIHYLISQNSRLIIAFKEIIMNEVEVLNDQTINYLIITNSDSFLAVDLLRLGGLIGMLSCMATLIFERIYATLQLKTYENTVSNLFFIFALQYQIYIAIGFTYLIYKEYINLPFSGITVHFISFTVYLVFVFLEWYNKKQYQISLMKTTKYTLSERFQLQENIRVALLVKRFAIVLFVLNFGVGANLIISNYLQKQNIRMCSYLSFNYFLNFYGFIFSFVWFFNHQKLKNRLQNLNCKVSPIGSTGKHAARDQLRSFNGIKLIFTPDEEREIAFKQLKNSWQ